MGAVQLVVVAVTEGDDWELLLIELEGVSGSRNSSGSCAFLRQGVSGSGCWDDSGDGGWVTDKDAVSLLANVAFDFLNFSDPSRLWASFGIGYGFER